ncbi:ubiquinol-cytochrome c reductase iron-sulfur subunit [Candidatus Albibeggiatoa sp. nov. NOAA]|uniref:ubiquinol-cytochrome c reductase iron-sulfur subunit n=1 Tax=Candidatus Albibeggiatoa sp. nov. NOAA TaxID=3162724 RepID=UPI0032F168EA|nr:ubiquinol-cytochrome c reductase iron-sulfur subunit [Thiotrichaceae bacterium]
MSKEGVDNSKRRFLSIAVNSVVGAVGVGFAAVPFVSYWQPSAKAQAAGAPVEIDISKLEEGQKVNVEWRGKPVWVVKRSQQNLDDLATLENVVSDPASDVPQQPDYAKNIFRAREDRKNILVVVGICTHLGCSPTYVKSDQPHSLGADWKGGFFCPCHGSKFDLAGRVYQGVPAPTNLVVPPYAYIDDNRIIVGVDSLEGAA